MRVKTHLFAVVFSLRFLLPPLSFRRLRYVSFCQGNGWFVAPSGIAALRLLSLGPKTFNDYTQANRRSTRMPLMIIITLEKNVLLFYYPTCLFLFILKSRFKKKKNRNLYAIVVSAYAWNTRLKKLYGSKWVMAFGGLGERASTYLSVFASFLMAFSNRFSVLQIIHFLC